MLENFGYIWPKVLNCSKFPEEQAHNNICMGGEKGGGQTFGYQPGTEGRLGGDKLGQSLTPNLLNTLQTNQLFKAEVEEKLQKGMNGDLEYNHLLDKYGGYMELLEKGQVDEDPKCPSREMQRVPRLNNRCIPLCGADVLFDSAEKWWADILMGIFAAVAFLASLFTVVTFLLVDCCAAAGGGSAASPHYLYPERSLVFIAFSCLGHSVGHLLRLAMGRGTVSCQDGLLSVEGHRDAHCFVVFLFVSFFSSAVSSWWTVTAANWLLSALGWRHKNFRGFVSVYHTFGWGAPAAVTLAAVVAHRIDADELTGLCGVGFQDSQSLLHFVLLPESALYIVSLALVVAAACVSYCCNGAQSATPQQREAIEHNKAVCKTLATFAAFYVVARGAVIASLAYECSHRNAWVAAPNSAAAAGPISWVFLLRLCLSLSYGVVCMFWIWSPESRNAWVQCLSAVAAQCFWKADKTKSPAASGANSFPTVSYSAQPTTGGVQSYIQQQHPVGEHPRRHQPHIPPPTEPAPPLPPPIASLHYQMQQQQHHHNLMHQLPQEKQPFLDTRQQGKIFI